MKMLFSVSAFPVGLHLNLLNETPPLTNSSGVQFPGLSLRFWMYI